MKQNSDGATLSRELSEKEKLEDRLGSVLVLIKNASYHEKMRLLQLLDDKDRNSMGHLCLVSDKLKHPYANILKLLEPCDLFTVLKINNKKNTSVFSLYQSAFDISDLISGCSSEPSIFCDILEHFEIKSSSLQSLVNIVGLKKRIRTYLLSLPDEEKNWLLLNRCLDQSTTIGKFCSKEAKRVHSYFQSNEERETTFSIRQKIKSRFPSSALAFPVSIGESNPLSKVFGSSEMSEAPHAAAVFFDSDEERLYQPVIATAPPLEAMLCRPVTESAVASLRHIERIVNEGNLAAPPTIPFNFKLSYHLAIVTGIALVIISLMYPYLNSSQENNAAFNP